MRAYCNPLNRFGNGVEQWFSTAAPKHPLCCSRPSITPLIFCGAIEKTSFCNKIKRVD